MNRSLKNSNPRVRVSEMMMFEVLVLVLFGIRSAERADYFPGSFYSLQWVCGIHTWAWAQALTLTCNENWAKAVRSGCRQP